MGSRGKFSKSYGRTGGIPIENREYSCIVNIGKIKIIQCDVKKNNPTPTYSNTANTTYFSYSKENGCIERIYYYKNHKLYKSVDFKNNENPHTHYWSNTVVGRKSHDRHNSHGLSNRDHRLMQQALDYNKTQKQLWKIKF